MDPISKPVAEPGPEQGQWMRAPLPEWLWLVALALVFIGWFLSDTLVTTIGAVEFEFHFFDMAAVIAEPGRLFTGVSANLGYLTIPFGLLCAAALAAPLAPYVSDSRLARLGRVAPLLLMLVCGAILYYETSQETFRAARDASDLANALVNLANVMARHPIGAAVRHVGIGAGAWLGGAGALYLGYTAVQR